MAPNALGFSRNRVFTRLVQRSYDYIEPSLVPVCVCGAVFMPLFHLVWRDVFPQPYENLTLRLIGAGFCLLLATSKHWPKRFRVYVPYLWYTTLIYALPFFVTFMLLKNGSGVWLLTAIAGLLLVVVLADWANMIIVNSTGTIAGLLFYIAQDSSIGNLEPYFQYAPVVGFAVVAGLVFNYRREMLVRAYLARERDLRWAKEDAEAANRAKSSFLATMGHELKTPLNAIMGFSEIMKNESFGSLGNDKYLEYADDIHTSGRHLLGIIDRILNLVRIESKRLELQIGDADLMEVLEASVVLAKARPDTNEVDIKIQIETSNLRIQTDEKKLTQILADLLANALKFTGTDGQITVHVSALAREFRISVSDTGIGIEPDQLDKIFEPFHQADSALNRHYEGAGLGLSLARSLARHLGGSLFLESVLGQGTRVVLTIPMSLPSAPKEIIAAVERSTAQLESSSTR